MSSHSDKIVSEQRARPKMVFVSGRFLGNKMIQKDGALCAFDLVSTNAIRV